jgi:prefoldin subunit 5
MAKRREALEQQREDIEAMLADILQFELQCRQELQRRASP